MSREKVIIIGGGPAGLTAAYRLLDNQDKFEVQLFEESGMAGGISKTIEYHGNRIDIGGHRFFSKNEEVNKIWKTLLPIQGKPAKDDIILEKRKEMSAGGPDPETADNVMLVRDRVSRIFYRRKFFDYPISVKPSTFINMGPLNSLKAGFSYLNSSLNKRPEKSLEDFYINRFGKQLYRMFFEDYTKKVWGLHPSELSPSWGAQRIKSLSIGNMVLEGICRTFNPKYKTAHTSLIEQFLYPKYGPGQMWRVMADKITKHGGGGGQYTSIRA